MTVHRARKLTRCRPAGCAPAERAHRPETYATERRIANSGDVGLQAIQSRIQARGRGGGGETPERPKPRPEDQNNFVDSFSASVQELDPLEQAYVARWPGVDFDEDGNLSARDGGPESLTTMAKLLGISRQAVHQKVKGGPRPNGAASWDAPRAAVRASGPACAAKSDLNNAGKQRRWRGWRGRRPGRSWGA